jgi:AbrB family looped-hinge helix DNA binding protein
MATATLTRKGQTTIPKEVREFLHLRAGDRMEFIIESDGRVWLRPATRDISALEGILPPPEKPVSLKDMKWAIRERGGRL